MILWFVDRFGLPGSYHRIWLSALIRADLTPKEFLLVDLHRIMHRQLLAKLGSRKAPTWIPTETDNIITKMNQQLQHHKPRAVVLASPESLAYLGLAPEHATLHNLRGSVYWKHGIPFIVTLPISAWNTLVSQKDIGAANYGFDSQESFTAARSEDGQVREEGRLPQDETGNGVSSDSTERLGKDPTRDRVSLGIGRSVDDVSRQDASQSSAQSSKRRDSNEGSTGVRQSDVGSAQHGILPVRAGDDSPGRSPSGQVLRDPDQAAGRTGADSGDGRAATESSVRQPAAGAGNAGQANPFVAFDRPLDLRSRSCGAGAGVVSHGGAVESAGTVRGDTDLARRDSDDHGSKVLDDVEYRSDRRYADSADGSEVESGSGGTAGSVDEDDVPDDSAYAGEDEDDVELSGGLDDDEEIDRFFYEPVLSPVGRYVITSDLMKLRRVIRDGKLSNGPSEPLILKW